MKVQLNKESKRQIFAYQLEAAKMIVDSMKEDEESTSGYLMDAIHAINGHCGTVKVYEATAIISRNCRAWNAYGDNSEDLDVWIEGVAKAGSEFVEIGAYLTDIWSISSENAEEVTAYMYVKRYN